MRKSTDWNWGLNEKSREARRVWPDLGVYAVVSPSPVAGRWDWHIYPQTGGHGPVRGGWARGSDAAKREATQTVNDLIAPAKRKNPSIGMPGMPHTWVTRGGVHVSGGDTIEYWSGRADLGQRRRKRGAVNRLLVFDDHVMVNDGWAGAYVGDDNFIRVVKRASRSNPDGATVPIRIYYRGDSRGVVARIPARFFKRTAGGSSLAGPNERERDRWVDRHYPGNVGWEQISEATYEVSDRVGRRNPSGSDKVRVLGIYPGGEVKELMVTAESLTWRKGKRKRDDRLSGPFLRKFGSYPVATIAMWGSDPDFHDEAKVREMLSRYLRDSGRDERRNPARRRSRDGVSREWRWA